MTQNRKSYVREMEVRYKGRLEIESKIFNDPRAVWEFLNPMVQDATKEHFITIPVNNKNKMLGYEIVSIGTISESIVHPREVFKSAILKNASSIIVAHNHPSGVLTPSKDDIETTKRLCEAGKILGIPILDHIILSDKGYLSMKEEGFRVFE